MSVEVRVESLESVESVELRVVQLFSFVMRANVLTKGAYKTNKKNKLIINKSKERNCKNEKDGIIAAVHYLRIGRKRTGIIKEMGIETWL